MSDNSGTHLKVTAAVVQAVQEVALKNLTSPIEAYSCNLHVLDSVQDIQQVTCMTLEDWCQAQQADPTLSLVISRLWDGTLGQWQSKHTDTPEFNQFLHERNHLLLQKGVLYRKSRPRESEETLFQLVLPAVHREVTLMGCHDEVGHLGLEHMLDLMHGWPVLLASHGCPGKGTYWKVSPVPHFQSQADQSPSWKYHGHTSFRACPPWLPVSGIWQTFGGECSGGNRPFHLIHSSVCYLSPNCPDHCQNPMGQVHCPFWVTQKDPIRPR